MATMTTMTTYPEPVRNLDLEKLKRKERKERDFHRGKVVRSNYLMETANFPTDPRLRIGNGSEI